MWSSQVRSTAPELNSGEGVTFLVREAALKLKEAPEPMQQEWERQNGSVHSERWQIRGGDRSAAYRCRQTGGDGGHCTPEVGSFYI
jgi:hypothetical protein